jgi:hypothetical protein
VAKPLRWRVQSKDDGGFDELVVSAGKGDALVHAEMMSDREIFVSVGELRVWAYVDKRGKAVVTMIENESEVQPVPKRAKR